MTLKFYVRVEDSELKQGYALDETSLELNQAQHPDSVFLEVGFFCSPDSHYFRDGGIVEKPARPSSCALWDPVGLSWVEHIELKADEVKGRRNSLLAASDWTQMPDAPQATSQAWAVYRQQLRDVPAQTGFPFDVVWPTPPQ